MLIKFDLRSLFLLTILVSVLVLASLPTCESRVTRPKSDEDDFEADDKTTTTKPSPKGSRSEVSEEGDDESKPDKKDGIAKKPKEEKSEKKNDEESSGSDTDITKSKGSRSSMTKKPSKKSDDEEDEEAPSTTKKPSKKSDNDEEEDANDKSKESRSSINERSSKMHYHDEAEFEDSDLNSEPYPEHVSRSYNDEEDDDYKPPGCANPFNVKKERDRRNKMREKKKIMMREKRKKNKSIDKDIGNSRISGGILSGE